jgi:hypothetical protein
MLRASGFASPVRLATAHLAAIDGRCFQLWQQSCRERHSGSTSQDPHIAAVYGYTATVLPVSAA